jgi:hypothetical protein
MLQITLAVNNRPIREVRVYNLGEEHREQREWLYDIYDGPNFISQVRHRRSDGAVALAIKALRSTLGE